MLIFFFNPDRTVGVRSEEKGIVFGTEPYEDHQSQYSPDVSITGHSYHNMTEKFFLIHI